MDNGNGQLNPHNSQNRQANNALSHILHTGVTPEQYAQNARQLEAYSRMNAMGLQVYLERQTRLAEQRRQDELRLVQLAQQLASGSQQHHQRQSLPAAPQVPQAHQPQTSQQPAMSSSRGATAQIYNHGQRSYNEPNTGDAMSQGVRYYRPHVTEPSRAPMPSVQQQQQQQHYSSFNASTPLGNQNIHTQRNMNHIRPIGGVGAVATSALSTYPQTAQQPKATTAASMQHQSQYPQYSGVATTGSQGQGSTSRMAPGQYEQVRSLYHSWEKVHGAERAAAMTKDLMQSWQQKRPMVQGPMHSATASSTAFPSATSLQMHSQSQIPNRSAPNEGVSAPLQPHFRSQEWASAPTIPEDVKLTPSQPHPHASSTLASPLRTDNLAPQTSVPIVSPQEFPTAPSSQSHSILLAPEEKPTALYTMRGLAASIKRSLNAERLAASGQSTPTVAADPQTKTVKRSPSVEVTGATEQSGPATAGTLEPVIVPAADTVEMVPVLNRDEGENPPSATVPSLFPQVSVLGETSSPDEATIPNSYQEPSHDFVPFSTLAGAVSFDNATSYAPADHPTIPSPIASTIEGLINSQQAPDLVSHDDMDPLLSFSEATFSGLSFPTRTPTPPLAAMITPFDDDGANAKTQETASFIPTSPCLDQVKIQPESTPPASEGGLEAMDISADGDQDRIGFNVASLSSENAIHPEAQIHDSPKEETSIFVRRTGLLDSPIKEISGESLESVRAGGYSEDEARNHVQTSEVSPAVHDSTWPTSGKSAFPSVTSSSSAVLKTPMKSAGGPTFYVAVPPLPEWVRRAKRREAANTRPTSEEGGQRSDREYAENELANRLCPRLCHWSGCQAVLNSMYTLKKHVRRHQSEVVPVGPAMTVSCQWKQCRMVCEQSSLLLHLNRHIEKEITCIYDDCDERFSRIQDLAAHERSEHANDEPPPCAIPQRPVLKTPVPLPETLPSYAVTTRPASKPSISAERHARLGPWVLGMTFGQPVTGSYGDTRLTDKALEVAPTLTFPGNGNSGEMATKSELMEPLAEYDLLEEPSTGSTRTRFFDDLKSVDITRVFRDGVNVERDLLFAPKEAASDIDEGKTSLHTAVDSDSMAVEALL